MGLWARIVAIFKGKSSQAVSKMEAANPEALLENEKNELKKAMANYNESLAKQHALVSRLKAQTLEQEKKNEMLKSRISALFAASQMDKAGELALQSKDLQRQVEENKAQLVQAEELVKSLTKQRDVYIDSAQKKIKSIEGKITRAKMAEAQAQLTEIASATAFNIDGSGANLDKINEHLDERIANAEGKAKVAQGQVEAADWNMSAAEQKALEAQALAEFASQMGLKSTAPAAASPNVAAPLDLGPVETAAPAAVKVPES